MNIRKAKLEDLDIIVEYNYNLAYETENKELDKEILTKGVRNIIQDENKGVYHVCEVDGNNYKVWIYDIEHGDKEYIESMYDIVKPAYEECIK